MDIKVTVDPNKLKVFHELTKRRIYVGELSYNTEDLIYTFTYDEHYRNMENAISIGPELDLFKQAHISKNLFPSFADRIPERSNPAYEDYCLSEGIAVNETNPIILLGTIGSRGPSTFIFEKVFKPSISLIDILEIRKKLNITQNDFALAFGISKITLQRIESNLSYDDKTIRLLLIYFSFPEVAIWQLYQTGALVHRKVLMKLFAYFRAQIKSN